MTPDGIVAVAVDPAFRGDLLFAEGSRDGSLDPFRLLRERLLEDRWEIHTADVVAAAGLTPDVLLWMNVPDVEPSELVPAGWGGVRQWAILWEPPVVTPANADVARHASFERLFTWQPSAVDGERYFRLEQPQMLEEGGGGRRVPERLCTLVAGNKRSRHPLELYSARRDVIRWFERHHPGDFDLYGVGWDRPPPDAPRIVRGLGRLAPRLVSRYPSYRGAIVSKRDVLRRYRFTICFENARELDGYVTEKIFDCLLAGSIPVYWGAPDIGSCVPPACFVDYRDFASNAELYEHLASMSEEDCERMRLAGRAFLEHDAHARYGAEAWVDVLAGHVLGAAAAHVRR